MTFEKIPYKIYLTEDEMPKTWYNVRADMKNKPAPLLNPGTGAPMGFDDLRPVFCDELVPTVSSGSTSSPTTTRWPSGAIRPSFRGSTRSTTGV